MDELQLLDMNEARALLGLDPLPPSEVLAGRNPGSWYRDWEHPRDRDGQWITKGGKLRALIGQNWRTGTARSMNPNNTVTVETEDGNVHQVDPKNIIADIKGVLPGRVAPAPGLPAKPEAPKRGAERHTGMETLKTDYDYRELGLPIPPSMEIGEKAKKADPYEGKVVLMTPRDQRSTKALWGVVTDAATGKAIKSIYSPDHHTYQAALKYRRTALMDEHFDGLLDSMRADAKTDPAAAAALVMAATGMRPSSEEGANQKGDKERTYGATTLEPRHVTFETDDEGREVVRFQFTGKSGKAQNIASRDPDLVAAVRAHMEGKRPDEQLFSGVSPDATSKYIKDHTAPELKNKDLRTFQANMLAAAMLARVEAMFPGGPKDRAQFDKMRAALGILVSEQLGNTPQVALNSYINPNIFQGWANKLDWRGDNVMEELWRSNSQT